MGLLSTLRPLPAGVNNSVTLRDHSSGHMMNLTGHKISLLNITIQSTYERTSGAQAYDGYRL